MQVGEIHFGTRGPVEAFDIGRQLNQVTGDKPRGQAQVAQQLHEQPRRIAARSRSVFQRVFGCLDAWFHADQVADVFTQTLVERHEEIHGRQRGAVDTVQVGFELRRQRQGFQVRRQLLALIGGVSERDFLRIRLQKEVEWIEHRHLGEQIHFDPQFIGFLRKH